MINIEYHNDGIKVTTENIHHFFPEHQLPLKLECLQQVTKKVIWYTELHNNGWASFPNNEMVDVLIRDKQDNILCRRPWNVITDGSFHYKSFYYYCKNLINLGIKPKGIAIGTHNGEFGEWVPLVQEQKIQAILIEASEKQFNELYNNFVIKDNVTMLNVLITPDGKDVEFFEGGRGYTNSVVERVIRHWEQEQIDSTIRSSIKLNEVIKNYYPDGMDWLHLDVEGLDASLIMSIEENLLPNFITFEDFNLTDVEKNTIYMWLENRKFVNFSSGGICTSIRQ